MGVGAVVQPGRVHPGVVEQRHLDGRCEGADDGDDEQYPEVPGQLQQAEDDQRPDQVELLLDGQRPGVGQRGRQPGLVEVARPDQDEVPVGHVEQGRQRVEPEVRVRPAGHDERGIAGDEEQHEQQRRQQAAGPAGPERAEPDRPEPVPLVDEERRDQEAGQDEERVDAEVAADEPRDPAVEGHDAEDGERPHPVERRDVREVRLFVRRVRIGHRADARRRIARSGRSGCALVLGHLAGLLPPKDDGTPGAAERSSSARSVTGERVPEF